MGQAHRDGPGHGRVPPWENPQPAAQVDGAAFLLPGHQAGKILRREDTVGIHPDNDVPSGLGDADIQGCRGDSFGVVQDFDKRVVSGKLGDDLPGAVRAHAVNDQHLQAVPGIVVVHNGHERSGNVGLLIPARHDDRDELGPP